MPPTSDMRTANFGSTTPSIAEASTGVRNSMWPRVKVGSTISGFVVTAPGTIATSSKPYACSNDFGLTVVEISVLGRSLVTTVHPTRLLDMTSIESSIETERNTRPPQARGS